MSKQGMSGVEMWSELQNILAWLKRWRTDLQKKTKKRKDVAGEMDEVIGALTPKLELQAGQKHAD